jgi:hypothetical protein
MALDSSGMDMADEAANAKFFGYPTATLGESAFPQARRLGLLECGTHAVVAADIAPYARSVRCCGECSRSFAAVEPCHTSGRATEATQRRSRSLKSAATMPKAG